MIYIKKLANRFLSLFEKKEDTTPFFPENEDKETWYPKVPYCERTDWDVDYGEIVTI